MKKVALFFLFMIFFIACGDDIKDTPDRNFTQPPNDVPIGINENKPNIDIQNPPEPVEQE